MYRLRHALRRCGALLCAVLLLASLAAPCASAAGSRVVRVGFSHAEGFSMTAPDGRRYGLIVDFLNEIAKYTGWEYEYIDTDSETMLDDFFAGKYDLLGGTYYASGYEAYFAYPHYNCGYSKLALLARKDDDTIKSYDLDSFNGKTIGVFERNKENIRRLRAYLEINGLDCTIKPYTYEELVVTGTLNRFLESGEIDLLLGNNGDAGGEFRVAATFDSQPHFIVTQPGNQEVLDGLNMALDRIYDADPEFAQKLFQKNFGNTIYGHVALNAAEKAYVAQKGTVTVAVPEQWHPVYCLDIDDSHDGLVPDFLREVTAFSGLEFSYIGCGSYGEAVRKVQQGEADILGFFIGTEEDAAERGLALTAAYIDLDSIVVRNKESSYPAEGLVGAVLEGREMPDTVVADEVRYYDCTSDALRDVNRGKVDFFYGLSSHLEYVIQQENFNNVVQVNLINNSLDGGFALKSPVQPELFTILNKTINNLTEAEKSAIGSRNILSIGQTHMTLSGIVYANPSLAVSVVAAFLGLILLAVILVFRARLHAAVMRSELAKAEADSLAKSEFLSRMSHEIRTPMNAIVGLTDLASMTEGLPAEARGHLDKIKASSRYLLGLISDILDMSRIENGKMELGSEPFSIGATLDEIRDMLTADAEARGLRFRMEKDIRDDMLCGDPIRLRQVLVNLLSNAFKFTPPGGEVTASVVEEASPGREAALTIRITDNGMGIAEEDQQRIFASFEQVGPNITKSQGTGLGLAISSNIVRLMGGKLKLKSAPGQGSEFYFTVTMPKAPAEARPAAEQGPQAGRLQGVHVLVVEDNDLNAEIAMELLRMQGAQASRAENGKKALQMFADSAPGGYDAILMDILMPEMNGLEATRAIRALPRPDAASVPVIAMTANAFQEDVQSAREAGMTGFVSKPVDVACLYGELQKALRKGLQDG
ncbi:ATP-binding protein [Intestinibacillus massiliensis]|uniref:ATP-binding protein n=1 Tax=Intestinibacillus massiliensis TaxID=1871029 RepID=UPI000B356898|nr:ATP-binding protein [Intestinibacillus massiliensis]